MKSLTLAVLLVFSAFSFSQGYFRIDTIQELDVYGELNEFPVIKSQSNPKAAEKINTYLQFNKLGLIYGAESSGLFINVGPTDDEVMGENYYDFHVNRNDERIFSITISFDATGAYTENYSKQYNFYSQTGDYITLNDLFPSGSLLEIGEITNQRCVQEINEFLHEVDTLSEMGLEQQGLYTACKNQFSESDWISPYDFMFNDSSIVIIMPRCSMHYNQDIDDLWKFYIDYDISSVEFYLNENIIKMLDGDKMKSSDIAGYWDKVYSGNIGKSEVTAIIGNDGGQLFGTYWYDKYKKGIMIYGRIEGDNVILTETLEGKETATFEGKLKDGVIKGSWKSLENGTTHPFVLSLD